MRILVVGAGALGGLVGAVLTEADHDVVLVEINRARTRLLAETGLFIAEVGKDERCVKIDVVASTQGLAPADLVFVAVKSYQTESAVREALPVVGPGTRVLSMQNGLGNAEMIAGIIGPERVLCGITYHSIQHVGPNRLRYRSGIKPIQIAPLDGKITAEVTAIGEVFRQAGLNTDIVEKIDHVIWQKLLHNAVVNPVSALTGLTCRELLEDEDAQAFMRDLCMEIVGVMRAHGVPIVDEEDPYRPVVNSQKALGKNRPSMWQDLARGNCTEVDAINGAIVVEAARLGLAAPHNKALAHFIHSRERQKILKKQQITKMLEARAAARPAPVARPTTKDLEGGMVFGRVPLKTTPRLKEIMRDYYRDLQAAARDPERHVAWCSGLGPVEIVRALGITPYFPENHVALIGASRQADRYIPHSLAEGFSQFASSAMTSDIGAMLVGDSPLVTVYGIDGPPPPDILVYSTNNGRSLIRWFEYYGNRFRKPVHGLHPPGALREIGQVEVDAAVQQILHLVPKLELVAGKRLDFNKLAEVVDCSARAASLWDEILELSRNVPSPLTFFDLLIHMAPMVVLRGTETAVEYYQLLKAEVEERVAGGLGAVPGERFRFYWEGPPIWCALRPLANLFLRHKAAIVAATYAHVFAIDGLDPNNPIETMARAYTRTFPNRSDDHKATYLIDKFKDYAVDGAVYHDGRTTPEHSNVRYGLEVRLRRATGLPSLVFEADSYDLRLFSMSRIQRQLEEFVEQLDWNSPGNGTWNGNGAREDAMEGRKR